MRALENLSIDESFSSQGIITGDIIVLTYRIPSMDATATSPVLPSKAASHLLLPSSSSVKRFVNPSSLSNTAAAASLTSDLLASSMLLTSDDLSLAAPAAARHELQAAAGGAAGGKKVVVPSRSLLAAAECPLAKKSETVTKPKQASPGLELADQPLSADAGTAAACLREPPPPSSYHRHRECDASRIPGGKCSRPVGEFSHELVICGCSLACRRRRRASTDSGDRKKKSKLESKGKEK